MRGSIKYLSNDQRESLRVIDVANDRLTGVRNED